MLDISIEVLWTDYLYWLSRTGYQQKRQRENRFIRPMKGTPERLGLMADMKAWCGDRQIACRQWLYSLFACRRWMYPPRLDRSHLCSEKHLERFRVFGDYDLYTKRLRELEAAANPASSLAKQGFDPNRDLSPTVEEIKYSYVLNGQVDICRAGARTETFGYHPASRVCAICSVRVECETDLRQSVPFDIMALRRGEITSVEAYRTAIQAQVRY